MIMIASVRNLNVLLQVKFVEVQLEQLHGPTPIMMESRLADSESLGRGRGSITGPVPVPRPGVSTAARRHCRGGHVLQSYRDHSSLVFVTSSQSPGRWLGTCKPRGRLANEHADGRPPPCREVTGTPAVPDMVWVET